MRGEITLGVQLVVLPRSILIHRVSSSLSDDEANTTAFGQTNCHGSGCYYKLSLFLAYCHRLLKITDRNATQSHGSVDEEIEFA